MTEQLHLMCTGRVTAELGLALTQEDLSTVVYGD